MRERPSRRVTKQTGPFLKVVISMLVKDEFHLRQTQAVRAIEKAQTLQGKKTLDGVDPT
jgi:hypothetical protein